MGKPARDLYRDNSVRLSISTWLVPNRSKQVFLRELKKAKPKGLPPLATIEKKLEKTMRGLDQTMVKLKVSERRMEALDRIDFLCGRSLGQ